MKGIWVVTPDVPGQPRYWHYHPQGLSTKLKAQNTSHCGVTINNLSSPLTATIPELRINNSKICEKCMKVFEAKREKDRRKNKWKQGQEI